MANTIKAQAQKEATYARKLLAELLNESDPSEREALANELVASVTEVAAILGTPNYSYEPRLHV